MIDGKVEQAQERFLRRHGTREAWRLYVSIESVIHGAPMLRESDPWTNMMFLNSAALLYEKLAEEDELDAAALGTVLQSEDTQHHIGGLGWELFWKWHVAVWIWDTTCTFDSTSRRVHGAEVSDHRRRFLVDEFERGLRGVVQRELVDYYFDHTEHGRDVGYAMEQAGHDFQCDAHGVGAYMGVVADIGTVRGIFEEMSKVPIVMTLKTFMEAAELAYSAASGLGYEHNLRKFDAVAKEIAAYRQRVGGRVLSNRYQRAIDPDDSALDGVADGAVVGGAKRSVFPEQRDIVALTIVDARHSVVSVVKQVQINQNALGVQFSESDIEKVIVGVANAPPTVIQRLLKDWLPSALTGLGLTMLLRILGV